MRTNIRQIRFKEGHGMLIVTDLDGTLLNGKGKLTDYTKKILKEVSKDNILIVASGRRLTRD